MVEISTKINIILIFFYFVKNNDYTLGAQLDGVIRAEKHTY